MPDRGSEPQIVTREELLRRAAALAPVLRERAASAEAARRCPDETMADFDRAGFLRICQPAQFGGYALGWDVLCEVGQTLAHGCGAQAWVAAVMGDHNHIASGLAIEAQREIWGEDSATRICASFVPVGKARSVTGGVVFSGRHGFASGIDHARWALAGGTIIDGARAGTRCLFLVPLSDGTLIDDWRVMGMAGTGSKSFELKEVFIPEHRILTYDDMDNATGPGSSAHSAPVFRMPHGGLAASVFACIAVGIAEGFLADYIAMTRKRVARGVQVAEMAGTQIALAAAAAEIEAAGHMYLAPVQEGMRMLARGERIPRERRLHAKRNATFAARLALSTVDRLFNAAGSRVLFEGDVLQRQFRDLHAATAHAALVWDVGMGDYGRNLLGLDQG